MFATGEMPPPDAIRKILIEELVQYLDNHNMIQYNRDYSVEYGSYSYAAKMSALEEIGYD